MKAVQTENHAGSLSYQNTLYRGQNQPANLHRAYEIVYVMEGKLTSTVGDRTETANPEEGFFFFPNQKHALTCADQNTFYLILHVSGFYIGSFHQQMQNMLPTCSRFCFSPATAMLLCRYIVDKPGLIAGQESIQPKPPLSALKSCVYACCADFSEQAAFQKSGGGQTDESMQQVLQYIEEHFTEDLTLKSIAQNFSYDCSYLSRVLNAAFGTNLKTLINQYRHEMAMDLLLNTDKTIADIALECGFQSLRSCNRVFDQMSHMSPSAIRQHHGEKRSLLFTNRRLGNYAKDPAVIRYHGIYYLYYTIRYIDQTTGIGIARSTNLDDWQDVGELPRNRACEQRGIASPAAIVLGDTIHLFYQTYGNWIRDAVCHAVSADGIHFEKDVENPVFSPNDDWCSGRAIDADVCVFDNRLYLYFATRDHTTEVQKLGCAFAPLDSGFGKGAWKQAVMQSILTPELKWEGQCIEAPATVVNNGQVFLFYAGAYDFFPQQIGCAVSDDGIFFRRLFPDPFISRGKPGEWNSSDSGHPYVFRDDDGRVYLFYQGTADEGKSWYISHVEIAFDEQNIPYIIK